MAGLRKVALLLHRPDLHHEGPKKVAARIFLHKQLTFFDKQQHGRSGTQQLQPAGEPSWLRNRILRPAGTRLMQERRPREPLRVATQNIICVFCSYVSNV